MGQEVAGGAFFFPLMWSCGLDMGSGKLEVCCRADRIAGYVGAGRAESVRAAVLFEMLLRWRLKCAAYSWLQRSGNNSSAHMSLVESRGCSPHAVPR